MTGPPPGNTLPPVCQPVIVELDGVFGELESGSIINAGGTDQSTFTVAGVPVLTKSGGGTGAICTGFSFTQSTPVTTWLIDHGGGTLNAAVTIYDTSNNQIFADVVHIVDVNNVQITFADAQAGRALVILF